MNDDPLDDIEDKLLSVRRTRKQPSKDDKILCSINALVVIAMLQAGRFLDRPELEKNAAVLMNILLNKFWDGKILRHSYYDGVFKELSFLFDAAAVLTAITMLFENDESWNGVMTEMTLYVESFKDGVKWRESWAEDFQTVYASWYDHPIPSSISLADMGLTRAALLKGKEVCSK